MSTEHHRLEVFSWIAGILSAVFAVYGYFRSTGATIETPPTQTSVPLPVASQPNSNPAPNLATGPIAPSFNCSKAIWKSEKIVCSSPPLAVLDLSLANAYRDAVARTPSRAVEFKASQNKWLRKVRETCDDVPCMQRIYEFRIQELRNM